MLIKPLFQWLVCREHSRKMSCYYVSSPVFSTVLRNCWRFSEGTFMERNLSESHHFASLCVYQDPHIVAKRGTCWLLQRWLKRAGQLQDITAHLLAVSVRYKPEFQSDPWFHNLIPILLTLLVLLVNQEQVVGVQLWPQGKNFLPAVTFWQFGLLITSIN